MSQYAPHKHPFPWGIREPTKTWLFGPPVLPLGAQRSDPLRPPSTIFWIRHCAQTPSLRFVADLLISVTSSTSRCCGFVVGFRFLYDKLYNKPTSNQSNGAWALGCIACTAWNAACCYTCSVVSLCICLSVTTVSPAKNGGTDRHAVWV